MPDDQIPDRSPFSRGGRVVFEALSGDPPPTFWSKWVAGVLGPLLMLSGAANLLLGRQGIAHSFRIVREMTGPAALLAAAAFAGIAMFLHFHYFWGNLRPHSRFTYYGKALGAGLGGGGLIAAIFVHVLSYS